MKYFTLAIYEDGMWSPQFGDYCRSTVRQESDDSYADYLAKHRKIVVSGDTQAEINEAIASLNGGL